MELNHERVRMILAFFRENGPIQIRNDGVALAEEWLARRTVHWVNDSEKLFARLYCDEPGRWYGFFVRRDDGYDAYVNQQRDISAESVRVDTAEEAHKWLEARAVDAGFAVER